MSALFEDNFELYGGRLSNARQGVWAEFYDASLAVPSFDEKNRYWMLCEENANYAGRAVFEAGAQSSVGVFTIFYYPELPDGDNSAPVYLMEGDNSVAAAVVVTQTGIVEVYNSAETRVATTNLPVVTSGTMFRMQVQIEFGDPTGAVQVRLGTVGETANEVIIDETGLSLPSTGAAQIGFGRVGGHQNSHPYYIKCFACYSLTGTYNSNWPNITGVYTSMINGDTALANLTARPRHMFGEGVARFFDSTVAASNREATVNCNVSGDFGPATGDFTVETYARWETIPGDDDANTLVAVWAEDISERSWRLSLKGANKDEGGLQWEHTTDGTAATRTIVHDVNWTPVIGHEYHIAVSRSGGVSRLFIDGVQQGLDVSDSADIHTPDARFTLGSELQNTSDPGFSDPVLNRFYGQLDETRVTVGAGRYTSNFTPAAPWPRDGSGDSDFADVVFLAGFDETISDESAFARTVNSGGATSRYVPEDGAAAYQVSRRKSPFDDSYLEAELLPATGILTVPVLPTDTETVTLGSATYTFVDTLSSANDVLIGADIDETLANLTAAINGGAGEGTKYGTGTSPNSDATAEAETPASGQLTATAIAPGTSGNSIASTEAMANGSWGAATLSGGTDLPGASEFGIETLPPTITGVRWLGIRNRSRLTEGTGRVQVSFDVGGSEDAGEDRSMTTNFVSYIDRVEEDPSTSGALTPLTLVDAKLKIERTE